MLPSSGGIVLLALACVGSDSSRDTGATDASTDQNAASDVEDAASDVAVASDGGQPGGSGLFSNGDFELGCLGWAQTNATVAQENGGRSGTSSCRVCIGSQAGASYYLTQNVAQPLLPGERWAASAWVKATADKASDPMSMTMTTYAAGGQTLDYAASGASDITGASWTQIGQILPVTQGAGASIAVVFGGDPPPNRQPGEGCFLIDDAKLEKLP
jgi:hypothetical protein